MVGEVDSSVVAKEEDDAAFFRNNSPTKSVKLEASSPGFPHDIGAEILLTFLRTILVKVSHWSSLRHLTSPASKSRNRSLLERFSGFKS